MGKKEDIITTLGSCADIGNNAKEYYNGLKKLAIIFDRNQDAAKFGNILSALANRDRFLIVDLLRKKDRCVCELEAVIDKSQPAISRHLKVLESAQLIRGWKHGKFTHYSLVKKNFEFFSKFSQEWTADITNWFGSV